MPMIAAAAASAISFVSSAAAAAGAALTGWLATPLVGILGEGGAIAFAGGALKMAATSLGSLALNAVLAPKVGTAGSPISFKADPSSPIRSVMGRYGTGGTQAHMRVWGRDGLMLSYLVMLSLGPIDGVEVFKANGNIVTFPNANGLAANVEPYKDKMWMTYKMGLPTDGALGPPPVGGTPAMEWDANCKTSGYAAAFWTMQNNSKKASYEGGPPKPTWVLRGQKLYDPRKDSTQTSIGGSGPHRMDDWRTWEFTENPHVHSYNFALGHFKKLTGGILDRTKKLGGIGAPPQALDLPTIVYAMNVADANGWKISGEWNTQDGKFQTMTGMLQAGGAVPVHVGAKIGFMVNAPKASVATITGDDILGNTNIKVMAARRDRFNLVYPRYISEANGWEYATAGAVTAAAYQAQDSGEERPKEITYNWVASAKQAAELAAYDLANTRETMKLAFHVKPYLVGLKIGDLVTVNSPERGLLNAPFIVTARPIDFMEGGVSLELRSETAGKHPWALGQAANPAPSPALSPVAPEPTTPDDMGWTVTPRPVDPDGTSQPVIGIEGEVPDGVGSVLFEYTTDPDDPAAWVTAYQGPPTTKKFEITGLYPLQQYWVGITYYSLTGVPSARLVKGPFTAPALYSEGEMVFPDGTSPIWNFDELSDLPVPPSSENQTQAYVAETGKLYSWNPDTNAWEPVVADATIEDGTLTNAKFVSGLRAAGLGSALPALPNSAWPEGAQFVLTTDGKTYTNNGGVWKTGVAAADIDGAIQAAQVAGVNAAAVIGQMVAEQLADSAVTSDKIASNAIVAGKIAAGAVVAGNIVAGAINTTHLAAGSVVASKMLVGDTSNMAPDSAIVDPDSWSFSASAVSIVTASPDSTSKNRFNVSQGTADVNVYGSWVPVEQNAEMFFSAVMGYGSGPIGGGSYVYLQTGQDDGSGNVSGLSSNAPTAVQNTTTRATFGQSIVVPNGHNVARLRFRRVTGGTATALFDSPIIRRRASGELIVDGAITTDKLAANSIVAGKVAAGAINASHIGAKAITTSKLAVGDYSNLVNDNFSDLASWSNTTSAVAYESGNSLDVGKTTWRWVTNRTGLGAFAFVGDTSSEHFSVEVGGAYHGTATVRMTAAAVGRHELYLMCYDASNAILPSGSLLIGRVNADGTAKTVTLSGIVTVPEGSVTGRLRMRVATNGSGVYTSGAYFRDLFARRAASGELIVDGSIIATKIATNAVTADKIVAGAVTAAKINVTNLAAINADLGIVTAGMLRSGTGGNRTEVDVNGVRVYVSGTLRAIMGQW